VQHNYKMFLVQLQYVSMVYTFCRGLSNKIQQNVNTSTTEKENTWRWSEIAGSQTMTRVPRSWHTVT